MQRVVAIGTSWAAQAPLPALSSHAGVELAAICSARIARAEEAAEKFGAAAAYDDFASMIERESADIVYVGGPVGLHAPMIRSALAAGAHVISEKPLAVDAAEADALVDEAESAGRRHATAFTMRLFPGPATIRQVLAEGAIGTPRHMHVSYWFGLPPSVPRVYGWLHDATAGGGLLAAMGSHYIDLIRWWTGAIDVTGGQTRIWRGQVDDDHGNPQIVTADDAFSFTARGSDDLLITMHASSEIAAPTAPRVEILGTEGSLALTGLDQLELSKPGAEPEAVELIDPITDEAARECASPRFGMVISDMLSAIESQRQCDPSFADAAAVQHAIDEIRRFAS
jgi:predicted dehydrogenase